MRATRKNNSRKTLIAVIIILAVVIAAGLVWWFVIKDDGTSTKTATDTANVNPLTGLSVEEGELPSRPVVVSTDNDNSDARPQSGLSEADIVYEVPIEGGGSRYEPIYYSNMPTQCGPTRSARPYIVDIAREYKAVLVHNGWSPQAKEYLKTDVVPYYPAAYNDDLFYRTSDRQIPHNQYTDLTKVWKKIKKDGYDKQQDVRTFKWLGDKDSSDGSSANTIKVNYADSIDNTYKYNADKKIYERYVNNEECKDLNNDKQITCSNILIQEISSKIYEGESERLDIDMTEGGKAYLFTQGKMVKGTWSRKDKDSATVFKDSDGNQMKLTPGKTWIQLIDQTVEFDHE
ncbi:MAG: DUF3048 domain-containing protein [Eubacteriaceae bacterium]|nr:DUF3048 domain-containing protein [Eubacteriaceae bacterium]